MSTPISTSDLLSDAAFHVNDTHVGQTLADLGLGGYTPIGLLQHAIDSLHSYVGLPWWGSIMVATAILRALTLPLVVRSYRNSARMNNISPTVSRLMNKMRAAPTQQEAALYSQELRLLFQKHNCNPFKSLISPLLQVPVFISFFLGLRRMCTAPLESMKDGGMYWFTDLTAADPYYVLPVLSCVTMLLTLELGTEVGARNSGMQQQATMKVMKIVFRFLAIGMLPVTAQFPTAIFCYWLTSNSCSMLQMVILNTPRIRKSFGIPELIKVEPPPEESKDKGIASNFKTGKLAVLYHMLMSSFNDKL
ncbi:uncharacterized protein TRIADDRAFT_23561 [Trichoplax adhaerens]|uniref:Membrane insertase YidC/Oxa/ALB C-terminal domain-containing protein n=1 Tax=Trichoplax adhaerens TaxID=10228 RepID=B3RVK5_TRIAD|nr:hypothetical protein TRIADDRAFT_23561 [Trichoplax adhaerens]EDV25515.1 hypothetical protein TRIADDRAFT_23561 [Trichoplax adhaerens]|eukprot:XP_002111548.1 hypothetical protein TRIADDRAFT_23561 [Trichoplax adhaerens]